MKLRPPSGRSFAILIATLQSGCDPSFDSQMLLKGYRVIGVEASSPEVSSEATVELRVHDFYAGSEPIEYDWSLCLVSWGAEQGFACSDEDYELDLGRQRDPVLDLGPDGIDLSSRLAEMDSDHSEGTARSLENGFDLWLALESGPACTGCENIRTVKRLVVREGNDSVNQNPVIDRFLVEGKLARGGRVTLRVETDRPERYVDRVTGQERREEYLYSWYTSQGQTAPTRSFGAKKESELTLPERAGQLELFVAVRDGRGGLAVEHTTLDVE